MVNDADVAADELTLDEPPDGSRELLEKRRRWRTSLAQAGTSEHLR